METPVKPISNADTRSRRSAALPLSGLAKIDARDDGSGRRGYPAGTGSRGQSGHLDDKPPRQDPADEQRPPRLAGHILPAAGTLLGVTATLIALVKLLETQVQATVVDELASGIGIVFLVAAVFSYSSIRLELYPRASRYVERVADVAFVLGLMALAALTSLFAWQVL